MNTSYTKIDKIVEQMVIESKNQAHDSAEKIMVYAELEEGVSSVDLFFCKSPKEVVYKFASQEPLGNKVLEFWNNLAAVPAHPRIKWRTMKLIIEGDKFNIEVKYPEQIDEDEDPLDRRKKIVDSEFKNCSIDYSNPYK